MLLIAGILLLQARSLLPCLLFRTTNPFTAELKYTITTYSSFDECAKACYYDEECTFVAYGDGSQPPTDTTCSIYKKGLTAFPAHPKVYEMNRTDNDTSSAVCNDLKCAAKQNYTKVNATDKLEIEEPQCPSNATLITLNVYTNTGGYHAYAINETAPMLQYTKQCSMKFLGMELNDCNSVPVYTRKDYSRLSSVTYQKTGYSKTGMSALPQPCFYNGTLQCYSSVKIHEHKRSHTDDFIYSSDSPNVSDPSGQYQPTEVTQGFWIVDSDCNF